MNHRVCAAQGVEEAECEEHSVKKLICIVLSVHWLALSAAACAHMAGSPHDPSESVHVHSAPDPHHGAHYDAHYDVHKESADFHHEFPGDHDSAPAGSEPSPDRSSEVHCFTLIPSEGGPPGAFSQAACYARYESLLSANALAPPVPPPD